MRASDVESNPWMSLSAFARLCLFCPKSSEGNPGVRKSSEKVISGVPEANVGGCVFAEC